MRDINTQENNARIANHILEIHQGRHGVKKIQDSDFPFEILKKYISYARSKCFPRLNQEASEKLQNLYVNDRQKSKEFKSVAKHSVPITVRQL